MAHDGNPLHICANFTAGIVRLSRRNATHRFSEHEAYGARAGFDGRRHGGGVMQAADFHHYAHAAISARPESRIDAINTAGSSLRINAVPTNTAR